MFAVIALGLYALAVVVALVVLLGRTGDAVAADVHRDRPAATGAGAETVEIEVNDGASADRIAGLLGDAGAVTDPGSLRILIALTEAAPQLQAGRYQFIAGSPPGEVLSRLLAGPNLVELITFREGLRPEEIGELLEREEVVTAEEWLAALAEPPRPEHHWFLDARPDVADFTGYLLPATYEIDNETTALDLRDMMLDAFDVQVTADLVEEAEAQGLTLHELLTLASIVEREAVHDDERAMVAAVFRNRLDIGMALGADPTVQYAVSVDPEGGAASVAAYGYWKDELTIDDLALDSPYNTYLYPGLPPGPIANPGIDSIVASVYAATSDYLYFVAHPDCDGRHLFAETLEEHEVNVAAFRASPCG